MSVPNLYGVTDARSRPTTSPEALAAPGLERDSETALVGRRLNPGSEWWTLAKLIED